MKLQAEVGSFVVAFRSCTGCSEGYLPLVQQVDVTDPRGYVRRVVFGDTGYTTSDTRALNQSEQQTTTYEYYADNLRKSATDQLGRVTTYQYDVNGNETQVTRLSGTPDAVDLPPKFAHLRLRNQVEHIPEAAEVVGKWESRAFCGISKQIGKLAV